MSAMKSQYGDKRSKSVFYAAANKGTIKGVEGKPKPPAYKFKFTRPKRSR
jgi:hypothetical protein